VENASSQIKFSFFSKLPAVLAITLAASSVALSEMAEAQPSNLAPWEQHHFLPPDIMWKPLPITYASVSRTQVSRASRPDPTLSFISADEPFVQAGFPPLPRRADLSSSNNPRSASNMGHYTPARAPITATQSATHNLVLQDEFSVPIKDSRPIENKTNADAKNGTIHF
jgi:hypothetical protein